MGVGPKKGSLHVGKRPVLEIPLDREALEQITAEAIAQGKTPEEWFRSAIIADENASPSTRQFAREAKVVFVDPPEEHPALTGVSFVCPHPGCGQGGRRHGQKCSEHNVLLLPVAGLGD